MLSFGGSFEREAAQRAERESGEGYI